MIRYIRAGETADKTLMNTIYLTNRGSILPKRKNIMDNIKDVLKDKHLKKSNNKRPINHSFESAAEFGKYVGLPTFFVMKLFRLYGQDKVLGTRSFLKDFPFDKRGPYGLIMWKLKGEKKDQVPTSTNKDVPNRNLEGQK